MAAENAFIGDGGDLITTYMVEWSKLPFTSLTPMIQSITLSCAFGPPSAADQRFALSLTTTNTHDQHGDSIHFHSGEFPVVGTFRSGDISVTASAYDVKKIIENMPNVDQVNVQRIENPLTWLVTFIGTRNPPPLFTVVTGSTVICGSSSINPVIASTTVLSTDLSYSWNTVSASLGSAAFDDQHFLITALLPGSPYYVQVSAMNSLGFGTRRVTSPAMLTVPVTPPTTPTQKEGSYGTGPELFIASPTSLLVTIGPPDFDGGSLAGVFVVEWDQRSTFDSGLSGQSMASATIPSSVVLCRYVYTYIYIYIYIYVYVYKNACVYIYPFMLYYEDKIITAVPINAILLLTH
jgi:hypothetical protein